MQNIDTVQIVHCESLRVTIKMTDDYLTLTIQESVCAWLESF